MAIWNIYLVLCLHNCPNISSEKTSKLLTINSVSHMRCLDGVTSKIRQLFKYHCLVCIWMILCRFLYYVMFPLNSLWHFYSILKCLLNKDYAPVLETQNDIRVNPCERYFYFSFLYAGMANQLWNMPWYAIYVNYTSKI